MDSSKNRENNTVVPNDGSYLGAKAGKALKDKKIKEDFDRAWEGQKGLLKNNVVKLTKNTSSIDVRWQSFVDWDNSKLIEPKRVKKSFYLESQGIKSCL